MDVDIIEVTSERSISDQIKQQDAEIRELKKKVYGLKQECEVFSQVIGALVYENGGLIKNSTFDRFQRMGFVAFGTRNLHETQQTEIAIHDS